MDITSANAKCFLTIEELFPAVVERAICPPLTVSRIEKGVPTVAIGIYLRVLYALQLDDDILWLAKEDKLGKALQDMSLKTRKRASKKDKTHVFQCIKSKMVLY